MLGTSLISGKNTFFLRSAAFTTEGRAEAAGHLLRVREAPDSCFEDRLPTVSSFLILYTQILG
jgi:hypothetical protein